MHNREHERTVILELLGDAWDEQPEMPLGRLLLDILQPENRVEELRGLDDAFFAIALESYISVFKRQA
jgi:hypothetical protein